MLSAPSLGACASGLPAFVRPAEVRVERVAIPDALMACREPPARLAADPWPTNGTFAVRYIAELELAIADYRACLAEIHKLNAPP